MGSTGLRMVLLCMLAVLVTAAWGQQPPPHILGTVLPEPPQQQMPWTPPKSTLPAPFVSSATILFAQGLADPRGCEYRAIEVVVGNSYYYDVGVVKTHGWVLPAAEGAAERFAVCWNGLVYPVATVGDAANAHADGLAMARVEDERRAAANREYPNSYSHRATDPFTEPQAVSAELVLPLKAVLLFRLGDEEAAQRVWQSWQTGVAEFQKQREKDPYLSLANDWAWALFDRTVCAHWRRDDHLALAGARLLTHLYPLIDAEAKQRGFDTRMYTSAHPISTSLPFLEELPALLADQERRAKAPHAADALPITPQRYPDTARRITALIDQFDEVGAMEWGQPGGVYNIYELVEEEGDAAVEPLLRCLESDTRLCRSVEGFSSHVSRWHHVEGVQVAAYYALSKILQTNFYDLLGANGMLWGREPEGRKKLAEQIRQYWKRFGSIPVEERWYQTLKDNTAPSAQWLQAANNIVCPYDIPISISGGRVSIPGRKPEEIPSLHGEVLRKKTNPSVTVLLSKRAHYLLEQGDPRMAAVMAGDLATWDPKGSNADLHNITMGLINIRGVEAQRSLINELGSLFETREMYGDPDMLPDYARWVRNVSPLLVEGSPDQVFKLMWRHPDQPDIAKAAVWLFTDAKSPWVPLLRRRAGASFPWELAQVLASPLLGMSSFRSLVLRGLEDTRQAGTVKVSASGQRIDYQTDLGWSNGLGDGAGDPLKPKPGATVDFRACDLYAWYVSNVMGAPRCELYWPLEQRKAAIAACADFLRRYGSHFSYVQRGMGRQGYASDREAVMHFTPLDHPATPLEVRRTQAVFSLADLGTARVVKLPTYPMHGRWTADKRFPQRNSTVDDITGKRMEMLSYDQSGVIWQAEEVQVHGRWQRYYGFVGRNVMARIPAEEVELPGDWPWQSLGAGVEGKIVITGQDGKQGPFGADEPITMTIALRNCLGVTRMLPSRLSDPAFAGSVLLLQGDVPWYGRGNAVELASLPGSAVPAIADNPASVTLAPAGELTVAIFPLARLREKLDSGRYTIELRATGTHLKGKIAGYFTVK